MKENKKKSVSFNLTSDTENTMTKEEFARLLKQSIYGKKHNPNKK